MMHVVMEKREDPPMHKPVAVAFSPQGAAEWVNATAASIHETYKRRRKWAHEDGHAIGRLTDIDEIKTRFYVVETPEVS